MHIEHLPGKMLAPVALIAVCLLMVPGASASDPVASYIILNESELSDEGVIEIEEGETIYLDGSDSFDPDGNIVSYSWNVTDHINPNNEIDNAERGASETDRVGIRGLDPGTYKITLTVTDDEGNTDSYFRVIHVREKQNDPSYFGIGLFSILVIGVVGLIHGQRVFMLRPLKGKAGKASFRELAGSRSPGKEYPMEPGEF